MPTIARSQITITEQRQDYTYIRYSDDGGQTFTAATPWMETGDYGNGRNLYIGQREYEWSGVAKRYSFEIPDGLVQAANGQKMTVSAYVEGENLNDPSVKHYMVDLCYQFSDSTSAWSNFNKIWFKKNDVPGMRYSLTTDLSGHILSKIWKTNVGLINRDGVPLASGVHLVIKDIKVEIGDTATEWSPAPEDQQFGLTPGKWLGVAVWDKPYPPLDPSAYSWSKVQGPDGQPGKAAEFYRLRAVAEKAVVDGSGKLTASLSYQVEHVTGADIELRDTSPDGMKIRYRGDTGTPADTVMGYGSTSTATYVLEDYSHVPHPDNLVVELLGADGSVLDRHTVPVTFSTVAALDINGQLGEITARVQGMAGGGRNLLKGTAFDKLREDCYRLSSGAIIDPAYKHGGHNSVDCSSTGAQENIYKGVFFTAAVDPNKVYTASVWVHGDPDTIDKDAYIEVFYTDSHGQRQPIALRSIKPAAAGAWQRLSETFAVPAGVSELACNFLVVRNGLLHIAEPMLASGNMLTDWQPAPEDAEAYLAEVNVSVGHIDSSVKDMKTGLESAGIHLDGEEKKITLKGNTEMVDANGKTTAMFKDGKVNADVIDADKVVANGIRSKTIDAQNATFENVNVVGKIESKSGSIAGWNFQDGLLGRGKDYDGLSLFDNQIIFNGEAAKRQAALGTFYRYGVPFLALLRDELETLASKVGMVVSLKNGKGNNFAIAATGGIISCDKGVHDYSLAMLNSSNNVLDLQNGSRFLVSGTNAVYLPRLSALRTSLDILAGVPFTAEATIIAAPRSGRLSVLGRPAGTSGADYIEILDNNANVTGDGAYGGSIPMADGDILCLVMVYDGSRYYALPKTSMT